MLVWNLNQRYEYTDGNYTVIIPQSENVNLPHYKYVLLDKLKDTLNLTGFNVKVIELEN